MKIKNVSNPAAFAVEWEAGENGNTYQLVNPRGVLSLMFGAKNDREGRSWSHMQVVDPSRFMDAPPRNFKEFREIADRYINE